MWNQTPLQKVERAFPCLVVLADDQQFLARSSIVAAGDVTQPAIADIKPLDNREAKRAGTLNDATAHWSSLFFDPRIRKTP